MNYEMRLNIQHSTFSIRPLAPNKSAKSDNAGLGALV